MHTGSGETREANLARERVVANMVLLLLVMIPAQPCAQAKGPTLQIRFLNFPPFFKLPRARAV